MIEKYFVKQAFRKLELEKFLEKHFSRAGFNSLSVVRNPMSTRLIVSVAKPGIAIGYSGKNIKTIGQTIEDKFGIKNPHIEIRSVDDPEYNVKFIAQNMVHDLERGINWKQVAYKEVKNLSDMPIMGFELIFKGKMLSKGGRKQKYRFVSGYLKTVGDQVKLVRAIKATANTRSGTIGIILRLVPPTTIFPDKIGKEDIERAIKKNQVSVEVDKTATKEEIVIAKELQEQIDNVVTKKEEVVKIKEPEKVVAKVVEKKAEIKKAEVIPAKKEIVKAEVKKEVKEKVVEKAVEKKIEEKKKEPEKVVENKVIEKKTVKKIPEKKKEDLKNPPKGNQGELPPEGEMCSPAGQKETKKKEEKK